MAFLKLAPTPRFDPNGQFLDSLRKYQMRGAPPAKSYLSMNAMQTPAFSGTVPEDSEDAILASLLDGVLAPAIGGSTGSTSKMPSGGISSLIGSDGISVDADLLSSIFGADDIAGRPGSSDELMPWVDVLPQTTRPSAGMGDMLSVDPAGLGSDDVGSLVAEAIAAAKAPVGPGAKPENLSYLPELEASDRKRALNEALMNAGAALLGSAGSGKYSEGLSKAMGLGLASYNQSLDKAQKMRDEQELRLRTRTEQEQKDWEFGQRKAERPLVIAKTGQELEKGAIDLKMDKDKLEQLNRGRKALETISGDDPIWATDSAKTLGLGPKFRAAIEAGAYDQAGLIYSAAASAAGKDIDAKQAHEFAMEIQKYSRGTQFGVADRYGANRVDNSDARNALALLGKQQAQLNEIRKAIRKAIDAGTPLGQPKKTNAEIEAEVLQSYKLTPEMYEQISESVQNALLGGVGGMNGLGGLGGNGGFEMGAGGEEELRSFISKITNPSAQSAAREIVVQLGSQGLSPAQVLQQLKSLPAFRGK